MKKKRPQWIPVVTGLLTRDNKVLLGRRPKGHSMPGVWEFPGGKIESGESPEVALQRELKEELAIDAEIGDLRFAATHNYGETGILILFYGVKFWKGQPKACHHTDLAWFQANELKNLELPDANKKVLNQIVEIL